MVATRIKKVRYEYSSVVGGGMGTRGGQGLGGRLDLCVCVCGGEEWQYPFPFMHFAPPVVTRRDDISPGVASPMLAGWFLSN